MRGDAPAGFVDALLLCGTRPFRLKRGFHSCDLCNPAKGHEVLSMDFDRRRIKLADAVWKHARRRPS